MAESNTQRYRIRKKTKKEFYQKVSPGKSFFTFLLFVEKIKFLDKKRSEIEIELLLGGVASLGSGLKARVITMLAPDQFN